MEVALLYKKEYSGFSSGKGEKVSLITGHGTCNVIEFETELLLPGDQSFWWEQWVPYWM
jgi:hypothetical protein